MVSLVAADTPLQTGCEAKERGALRRLEGEGQMLTVGQNKLFQGPEGITRRD